MRMRQAVMALLLLAGGLTAAAAAAAGAGPAAGSSPPRAALSTATAAASTDWPSYHGNDWRTGYSTSMPTYTGGLHVSKQIALDGAVYAAPIVAAGLTIVATENDTVYAFNSANQQVWKRHLGAPSPASQRPCGDIDPLGITGTPVYYSGNGLVYVAAEFSASPPTHRLYGLNLRTGAMAVSRSLDLPGVDRVAMQQRGALALSRGRVWVPFGGLAGDCGNYKGRLVGTSVGGGGSQLSYTVPTRREAGMWAPPGPTVAGDGSLYVAVGNGASGVGDTYDHSDSILRIDASTGRLIDSFSPTTWATDNNADLDLGSQGPTFVGPWVFSAGKSGTAYILRRTHLGGIGGQVSKASLCRSFGGTAVVGNTVYVPCTDGVRAVWVDPKSGVMHPAWRQTTASGSPVYGGGLIWTLDTGSGTLRGLDLHNGSRHVSVGVGAVNRFATPAISGRRILVGTLAGLTVLTF
jgi:hypothetical protein